MKSYFNQKKKKKKAIDRDPMIWNDLLSFKPERFLDSCLDIKGNNFDYMPSGAGRKIFPGQPFGY